MVVHHRISTWSYCNYCDRDASRKSGWHAIVSRSQSTDTHDTVRLTAHRHTSGDAKIAANIANLRLRL